MFTQQTRNKFANSFPPAHVLRGKRNMKILQLARPFGDDIITNAIESGGPKLIGRLGGTEARVLGCYLDIFKGKSLWDPFSTVFSILSFKKRLNQLREGAGVYPISRPVVKSFLSEYLLALETIDVLGTWGSTFTWVEKYALRSGGTPAVSHHLVAPWVNSFVNSKANSKPWSFSLDGKKILVVGGFSQSFKSQHERIDKVFPSNFYPKFNAKFIAAPISQGGINDGQTWVDHLERMKKEMEETDFDVALISAGAYALPLACHAKKLGKVGITCGGELQLFFGVIGKRWENSEKVTKYRNEFWVRPSEDERPANWREIEDGCYW
ncbi:hypothetical protein MCEMKE157_01355 [actinobacterium SCGC AAA044-D11]